jgi:NAD-dependent SIR2 family protein deacetylase
MQSTTKFKDFIKVLEEDYGQEMMPDVVRDQSGQKTEYPAQASSVRDIFDKNYRTDVAPENIPYPLNEFDDVAANAFIALQNLDELLKVANSNEVIKNKKPLESIGDDIVRLKGKLVDITKKVSKIK